MSDDGTQWFIEGLKRLENATPEEREALSDDELFTAAVNIVANKLNNDGAELLQVYPAPGSVPAIWFNGNGRLNYAVITAARYPAKAAPPCDIPQILAQLSEQNADGYWIGVGLAHELEVFDPESDEGLPLMKGFGLLPAISDPMPLRALINS